MIENHQTVCFGVRAHNVISALLLSNIFRYKNITLMFLLLLHECFRSLQGLQIGESTSCDLSVILSQFFIFCPALALNFS